MLRKISFALVAAAALGTAALAPTSASAWGHGRGAMPVDTMAAGCIGASAGPPGFRLWRAGMVLLPSAPLPVTAAKRPGLNGPAGFLERSRRSDG